MRTKIYNGKKRTAPPNHQVLQTKEKNQEEEEEATFYFFKKRINYNKQNKKELATEKKNYMIIPRHT